jgi:hypothetical protein
MKARTARRLVASPAVRRVGFLIVRRQVKRRARRYVKIAIVLAIVGAIVGGYLASRDDAEPDELGSTGY